MKFPREMWAGSLRDNAREASRIVVNNKEEYTNFIKTYNGKMNVFTSVYDYEFFTPNRGLEYSVILDRIFLDFDAHGDNESLPDLFEDVKTMHNWLVDKDYKHTIAFSGRGFHIFAYGKVTSIRNIKAFFNICHDVVKGSNYLDKVVINTSRLRRVQNTYHLGASRWCIPITSKDLHKGIKYIIELSEKGRRNINPVIYGNTLIDWPNVKSMEVVDIEIDSVESPGNIPILPCLKNSVMSENPNHRARVLLVQWYNEILSEMAVLEHGLDCTPRQLSGNILTAIKKEIEQEIFTIASNNDTWIDYNKNTTKGHVNYIVDGRYMSPSCDTLINEGLCIGKCWRYGQ